MGEIRAIEPCGLVAASTFSGCGGSSLGYRMAGFSVRYANEFVEAARDTYAANQSPATFLDGRDIRTVTGAEILEYCGGSVDLLDGSPPCSDFSTAGKREKGWGKVKQYSDTEQRVDDLFFEFARLVREVQPRCFVAENVSGLVKGSAKGYFKLILAALRDCGYRVEAKLLTASWLGVPQARQRLIFVGVRADQGFDPIFPKPLPYQYTVREAICPDEPLLAVYDTMGTVGGFAKATDTTDTPSQTITTQTHLHYQLFGGAKLEKDPETGQNLVFTKYSIYETWKRLGIGESPSGSYFNLIRTNPDRPAPTIAASHGSPGVASAAHWEIPRKFSLGECRRLCSFPDDFILTGDYAQRWERLGRAVPPVMMSHIAAGLRDALLADRSLTHV
jgi:DNA (cytosine-5)-methyltransferase 1